MDTTKGENKNWIDLLTKVKGAFHYCIFTGNRKNTIFFLKIFSFFLVGLK